MRKSQLRRVLRRIIKETMDWSPDANPNLEPMNFRLGELLAAGWDDFAMIEEAIHFGESHGLLKVMERTPTDLIFEVSIEAYDVMAQIYGPETSAPEQRLFDIWFEDRCGFGIVDRQRGITLFELSSGDIPGWRS